MRTELQQRFDFSTYACFSAIVNSEAGNSVDKSRIMQGALGKYLVKNGYYATERELLAILRRVDIDQDGKVLYSDLSEYIKPRELPRFVVNNSRQASPPPSKKTPSKSPSRVRFADEEAKGSKSPPRSGVTDMVSKTNGSIVR